jgi:putative tryptophan/tyrosine transport system substrate-binding protein
MVFGVQALSRIVNFTNVEVSGYDSSPDEELDMRRRDFIAVVSGATVAMPISTRAQQPKMPTVGVLVRDAPGWEQFWKMFPKALNDLGYVEGKNIRFEFRSDKGQQGRLPELAAELVRIKVDVIVAWFTQAAIAARQATREIPIVCALCGDLVGNGLAESLARPGGNVTGIANLGPELAAKNIELIRQVVPSTKRIIVLANALDPFFELFVKQIQHAGETTGTAIDPIMIRDAEELDVAFQAMEKRRPDAVIVQPSLPTKRLAELALSHRIPSASTIPALVYAGGLMSYHALEAELYRRAAALVDKILNGNKPADLPVEQPTRYELVINLKTAKAFGLAIPPIVLARADELIE